MKKASGPTADELKEVLWTNIQNLRSKKITPELANSIAYSAREMMRVVKEQRVIAQLSGQIPSKDFLSFHKLDQRTGLTAGDLH